MRLVLPILLLAALAGGSARADEASDRADYLAQCPAVRRQVQDLTARYAKVQAESAALTGVASLRAICDYGRDFRAGITEVVRTLRTCQAEGAVGLEVTAQRFLALGVLSEQGKVQNCD